VPLSSPGGLLLPSRLGTGIWWGEALLVSPFNMEWDALRGLGVWRCWSFASS
jgi:hypothetical protein